MVSHCVQSRTGASTIPILGRNVLWPIAACTRMSLRSNMIDLATRRNQIEQAKSEIPSEDSKVLETPGNRRDKEHGSRCQEQSDGKDVLYRENGSKKGRITRPSFLSTSKA
jgi:hypothetical protein